MEITLEEDQQRVYDAVLDWYKSTPNGQLSNEFIVGGFAGTGKTTVIKALMDSGVFENVAVVSFTGKAVSVLVSKGVKAQTLHSLMYNVKWDAETKTTHFSRREELGADLVIVDEASMLSTDLYEDLKSYDVPMLFVGDVGQLEPIGRNPNLMSKPDVVLQKIHRQAAGSPIIQLSVQVREGKPKRLWRSSESVKLGDTDTFYAAVFESDLAVCGYNKTRVAVNDAVRDARGFSGLIGKGERVICLCNNRGKGVHNGMQATVKSVTHSVIPGVEGLSSAQDILSLDLLTDYGQELKGMRVDQRQFGLEKFVYGDHQDARTGKLTDPQLTFWDYAYCVTCHKAQGSEADRVAVLEQGHKSWDMKRWAYTALTRAKKSLTYCW